MGFWLHFMMQRCPLAQMYLGVIERDLSKDTSEITPQTGITPLFQNGRQNCIMPHIFTSVADIETKSGSKYTFLRSRNKLKHELRWKYQYLWHVWLPMAAEAILNLKFCFKLLLIENEYENHCQFWKFLELNSFVETAVKWKKEHKTLHNMHNLYLNIMWLELKPAHTTRNRHGVENVIYLWRLRLTYM